MSAEPDGLDQFDLPSDLNELNDDAPPGVQEVWEAYLGVESVYIAAAGISDQPDPELTIITNAANSTE